MNSPASPLTKSAIFFFSVLGALWPEISVLSGWIAAIAWQPVRMFFLKHYIGAAIAHFWFVYFTHQKTPLGRVRQ